MNRGSLKTRFISEVDGDDSENLQKNCYVADFILWYISEMNVKKGEAVIVPQNININYSMKKLRYENTKEA